MAEQLKGFLREWGGVIFGSLFVSAFAGLMVMAAREDARHSDVCVDWAHSKIVWYDENGTAHYETKDYCRQTRKAYSAYDEQGNRIPGLDK